MVTKAKPKKCQFHHLDIVVVSYSIEHILNESLIFTH